MCFASHTLQHRGLARVHLRFCLVFVSVGGVLSTLIAVAFALASAITVAWGTVIRHRIALEALGPVMRTSMANPLWWIGTLAAVAAYGLQIIALGFGTLLVVQPILVLSLMFTLPLSAWYSRRRMAFHEVFWSIALTIAVGIMVIYGRPSAGTPHPSWNDWWPGLIVGIGALSGLGYAAWRFRNYRALLLGVCSGIIYGYVALLSKSVVNIFTHEGLGGLINDWPLYALVLMAGTGTVMQQYSFHAGPLSQSLPAMTIMEPLVAFGLGYAVLGEKFQVNSLLGWLVMSAALAVMIFATIILSRVPVGVTTNAAELQRPPS